jgi:hypothetical protein
MLFALLGGYYYGLFHNSICRPVTFSKTSLESTKRMQWLKYGLWYSIFSLFYIIPLGMDVIPLCTMDCCGNFISSVKAFSGSINVNSFLSGLMVWVSV